MKNRLFILLSLALGIGAISAVSMEQMKKNIAGELKTNPGRAASYIASYDAGIKALSGELATAMLAANVELGDDGEYFFDPSAGDVQEESDSFKKIQAKIADYQELIEYVNSIAKPTKRAVSQAEKKISKSPGKKVFSVLSSNIRVCIKGHKNRKSRVDTAIKARIQKRHEGVKRLLANLKGRGRRKRTSSSVVIPGLARVLSDADVFGHVTVDLEKASHEPVAHAFTTVTYSPTYKVVAGGGVLAGGCAEMNVFPALSPLNPLDIVKNR